MAHGAPGSCRPPRQLLHKEGEESEGERGCGSGHCKQQRVGFRPLGLQCDGCA